MRQHCAGYITLHGREDVARMNRMVPAFALWAAISTGAVSAGAQQARASAGTDDSTAIAGVVEHFHAALARGDSAGAAALLGESAVVLEGGDYETRSDYLRHHLPADIAFARAVPSTRQIRNVTQAGSAAWVTSTSRATGTFNGRPVDSEGAELMVLARTTAGWRITAIHWSSHRRTR